MYMTERDGEMLDRLVYEWTEKAKGSCQKDLSFLRYRTLIRMAYGVIFGTGALLMLAYCISCGDFSYKALVVQPDKILLLSVSLIMLILGVVLFVAYESSAGAAQKRLVIWKLAERLDFDAGITLGGRDVETD